MKRYLSLKATSRDPDAFDSDKASFTTVTTISDPSEKTPAFLPSPNLKIQKLDYYYSEWSSAWKYKKMGSDVVAEVVQTPPKKGNEDAWAQYCFVVVRTLNKNALGIENSTFKVVIKSPYLKRALEHVLEYIPGVSWNVEALELQPKVLLCFLPKLEAYQECLHSGKSRSQEDTYRLQTLDVLLDYLHTDYRATINSFHQLTAHGEITYDLISMLFVPRTVLLSTCSVTGEPQALRLISATEMAPSYLELRCYRIDVVNTGSGLTYSTGFGEVEINLTLSSFDGAIDICDLEAYPIQFDPDEEDLKKKLIERGRKWASLQGIHHMEYQGISELATNDTTTNYNVKSRVIIDREHFKRFNASYVFPLFRSLITPAGMISRKKGRRRATSPRHGVGQENVELSDDQLMLSPSYLFGFSLADKLWLKLNIERIKPIEWNLEAFKNLILPGNRKELLQSLVDAHNDELGLDDFVRGKGRGLVVNLFGPPGVGKTLSTEATSEHVKRPLYIVGASELGTTATELDASLTRVFELAASWKAIVLIDEADIYLEQRSLYDLERNAMVAVFLRHLEYYRGILFLTTNRVQVIDDAFLSRIHVALRFGSLDFAAKVQIWTAFLRKAQSQSVLGSAISDLEISDLARRELNGREIKNAVRTANSLAVARGEALSCKHVREVLDVMEQFSIEFSAAALQDKI